MEWCASWRTRGCRSSGPGAPVTFRVWSFSSTADGDTFTSDNSEGVPRLARVGTCSGSSEVNTLEKHVFRRPALAFPSLTGRPDASLRLTILGLVFNLLLLYLQNALGFLLISATSQVSYCHHRFLFRCQSLFRLARNLAMSSGSFLLTDCCHRIFFLFLSFNALFMTYMLLEWELGFRNAGCYNLVNCVLGKVIAIINWTG